MSFNWRAANALPLPISSTASVWRRAKGSAVNRGNPLPVSPARKVALQILVRVESGRVYAVDWLQAPQVSQLKEIDRSLVTELVMGVLRWRGALDFQLEQLSGKPLKYFDPPVATILRMGIYQIQFLERVPKSAVVNEAVELTKAIRKRSAAGLVNAVLRKCRPLTAPALSAPTRESLEWACRSIPPWLLQRWVLCFGPAAAQALAWASVSRPHTTLRVLTERCGREELQRLLAAEGIVAAICDYSDYALRIESGNLPASELLREGKVILQDEASQLVAMLVAPQEGHRILDLCAAPGLKTSQLAAELREGLLVACDLSARRLRLMQKLLLKHVPGRVRLHIVRLDATKPLPFSEYFDRVLVDVPCSGTGTLARNPEIKLRLRPEDLPRLAEMQAAILTNALAALAPGGRAVYATCSLEPEENEQVVERVLRATEGFQPLSRAELEREFPAISSLFDASGYFRTRPDLHRMDGFFAAVIARSGGGRRPV